MLSRFNDIVETFIGKEDKKNILSTIIKKIEKLEDDLTMKKDEFLLLI